MRSFIWKIRDGDTTSAPVLVILSAKESLQQDIGKKLDSLLQFKEYHWALQVEVWPFWMEGDKVLSWKTMEEALMKLTGFCKKRGLKYEPISLKQQKKS